MRTQRRRLIQYLSHHKTTTRAHHQHILLNPSLSMRRRCLIMHILERMAMMEWERRSMRC